MTTPAKKTAAAPKTATKTAEAVPVKAAAPAAAAAPTAAPEVEFELFAVGDAEEYIPRAHKRSKNQLVVDDLVKAAYAAWVAKGKPSEARERPRKHIEVSSNEAVVEATEKMVRSAAVLHDVGLRFYGYQAGSAAGRVRVVFSCQAKQDYKPRAKKAAAAKKTAASPQN